MKHSEMAHTKTIGLVLSSVPKYSETFFRNKIKGLQAAGYKVILFVDYGSNDENAFSCDVVKAPRFNRNKRSLLLQSLQIVCKSLLSHPRSTFLHYRLDRRDGMSFSQALKNLIRNEHLLRKKVNWLHFGFGILARQRENVAQAIGAKFAVSFRGYDLYLSPLKRPNCYDILFTKDVQYHVLSNEMKDALKTHNIKSEKIQVITPAIDVNLFQRSHSKKRGAALKFVTVARLHWKKGLEYTLEALAILKDQKIDFEYTIIGEGAEKERLLFAAYQLGLTNHIKFTGKIAQTEVRNHLEQADVYIQYSIQEGFCNAVLESQAMGLLTIVSNAEGLSENVIHEQTGWVVPKRQPKRLAEAIEMVLGLDQEKKQKIQRAATDRVKEQFNLTKQNNEFLNFYAGS